MKPVFSAWTAEEDNEPVRTRKGIGIIEMWSTDDDMIMYCPFCKKAGFNVRVGPKILMPGETRQPDYESWLQCPDCFEVLAAHVIEHDATIIKDDIETVDNPFENTTEIIGAHAKRTSPQGKKAAAKIKRDRTKLDDDPEIDPLLKKHGDRVKVLE